MQEKQTRYALSRRKILVGMGAVGLASAGAGLGTSALFSDSEAFEGNSVTAGTLDMTVTATKVASSPFYGVTNDPETHTQLVADDVEPVVGFQLDDIKPGDWCLVCFDIEVGENPGYVQVSATKTEDHDNGINDPESEVDSTDGPGAGELDEAILASIWYTYDDSGDKAGLVGLDTISNQGAYDSGTDTLADDVGDLPGRGYAMPDDLAITATQYGRAGDDDVVYTTLDELLAAYAGGAIISDANGPIEVGPDGVTYYLLLELPAFIGNEVQSDSVAFDIRFDTEQVRNNPDPFTTEAKR